MLLLAVKTHTKKLLVYLGFLQVWIYELSRYTKLERLEMAGLVLQKIVICICHFNEDLFQHSPLEFGMKKRFALKRANTNSI